MLKLHEYFIDSLIIMRYLYDIKIIFINNYKTIIYIDKIKNFT